VQQEFVRAAVALAARRRRLGRLALVVLVVLGVAGFGVVLRARVESKHQRDQALSRRLASAAAAQLSTAPLLALRLALGAYDAAPTDEAERALRQATANSPLRAVLRGPRASAPLAFADNGHLATVGRDGVSIWDWQRHRVLLTLHTTLTTVVAGAFSPSGRHLLVAGARGSTARAELWNVRTRSARAIPPPRDGASSYSSVAFSPDGAQFAMGASNGTLALWSVPLGRRPFTLGRSNRELAEVTKIALSSDGEFLASVRTTGNVRDGDVVTVYDLYGRESPRSTRWSLPPDAIAFRDRDPTDSYSANAVVGVSLDGVREWAWRSARRPAEPRIPITFGGVALSADASRAIGIWRRHLQVWDSNIPNGWLSCRSFPRTTIRRSPSSR
jgi:WD40 repeat protein